MVTFIRAEVCLYFECLVVLILHSGFGLSDWPIMTDFVGGNFRQHALFLVRATEKTKTALDQKIHKKIIGAVNVD